MIFNFGNTGSGARNPARANWLSNLNWQVDFYRKSNRKRRVDTEFEWEWFERYRARGNENPQPTYQIWINNNANQIWETRMLLADDLSKLLFDNMLILRSCDAEQFYFPRINFEDFVSVVSDEPFTSNELPRDYLGLPLRVFSLELNGRNSTPLKVISTAAQIRLLNSYRQYFIQRNTVNMTPAPGDVILDCGACIGEISLLMAGLVGVQGEVHLFDPVPLHARYCHFQASLNPGIAGVLRINVLAVGDSTSEATGAVNDMSTISPGGLAVDSYSMITLDEYVQRNKLVKVDYIKMDIEGAELAALRGSSRIVRQHKPRLAISAYHKFEDLWELPHQLKELHGDYTLYFGHHSPMEWESVLYAV